MATALGSARYPASQTHRTEWVTLGMILTVYAVWFCALFVLPLAFASPVLVVMLVLHASLTHEVCHGHPLRSRTASEALVHFNPGLAVPFLRFRDTHLAHHQDALLTDPYDDPESNYLDPAQWDRMPKALTWIYLINNTLGGRMIFGPLLGQIAFMIGDVRAIRHGDGQVLRAWVMHLCGVLLCLVCVAASDVPVWIYLVCCYVALGILKIRTFLEHRAHAAARARTVIIEDRGVLAFLFLNNNFHAVHHMHPSVPWYRLPELYGADRDRYLKCNDGYRYASYCEIFKAYFIKAKDSVAHPLWPFRSE